MGKNWYVVHTYSGYEDKVKQSIEKRAEEKGLKDKITNILIPTEKVIERRGSKKRESDKKFYPGYILVEMELDDETWHLIRSTPRVTGFVGGTKPVPLSEEEVNVIVQQVQKGPMQVRTQYVTGDEVKIIDGPFSGFVGKVDEVDIDHGRLKVIVKIFGRETPVELNFSQVEKER
ncbi:MAG: transcription termination/antitermination protein NusG [Thermodesulfovibrionales bacterium]|nr:transcription termination/antitermination protein NusG [Thermodesulfovibrionales bacterium]